MDWNSEDGKRLAERLQTEPVIWLTTVREDGLPMPTPVWFLWEGETFLIYTQPTSAKLENIAVNPRASLNLNSDEEGGSVGIFRGEIFVDPSALPAVENTAYLEKYREGIQDIQMTPETFSVDYSVALRFRPAQIRAW